MWTARVTEIANTFSTGQAHVMHIIEPSFHLNLINEWLPPPRRGWCGCGGRKSIDGRS